MPRSRPKRLREAKRRLDEELWTEVRANRAYEAYRARGRMKDGRRFGRPPDPYQPPATPEGRINVTDPDSRVVKGLRGWMQGYNGQAVVNEHQVILAAEVETVGADFGHLEPMLDAAQSELSPTQRAVARPLLDKRRCCGTRTCVANSEGCPCPPSSKTMQPPRWRRLPSRRSSLVAAA